MIIIENGNSSIKLSHHSSEITFYKEQIFNTLEDFYTYAGTTSQPTAHLLKLCLSRLNTFLNK